ncbi:HK97 family phage prohead protease [Bifidobacterium cuniculi]|uniref:Prohead protease n=1 Tax=Bifidobacterium cuniculi TaxID=1688 RepID=A0A087B4F0_9BIFI|nr:HK97 family phage prohead protease [Bifidobacterium cuniculi]KFI65900.1 prohead protease [Bifidobacterium cuniculi]
MILTKTTRTRFKTKEQDEEDPNGPLQFDGYASVFDNVDLGGDLIRKGAFAETLANRYPDDGAGIPVYWEHDTSDPFKNLGVTTKAVEDEHGLHVEGTIDRSTDMGRQVSKLLQEGRVQQMSFAYEITDGAWVDGKKNEDGSWTPGYYELRGVDLFEVSICPIGMNQSTEVSAKKSVLGLGPHEEPERQEPEPTKKSCQDATPRLDMAARRLKLINL